MITPLSAKNEDFFERVYAVVRLIPSGRVTSYGAIAAYLGAKKSSRMVGWAMNAAHKFDDIPAHRVVNRNGMLTGKMHFKTAIEMQSLLESEQTSVANDRISEFKSKFWDPMVELTID